MSGLPQEVFPAGLTAVTANTRNNKRIRHMAEEKTTGPSKEREEELLRTLLADERVREMKNYTQHGKISTYDHCKKVAEVSCGMNRKLHLHADPDVLIRGAVLHDFYLYDWHEKDGGSHDWHGFIHAERARQNAEQQFHAGKEVQHVIRSHMWPLNITRVPRSREAWIVCLSDKWVSLYETLLRR